MKRMPFQYVSQKLSPLERHAVSMLFSGATTHEVMRLTGMTIPQIEAARARQFTHMTTP